MPLIAMNREMGSLGKDVAQGLSDALGLKVQHHEIIDHLANRARIRKSHVISFLEGTQGILERLTVDNLKLRILTADDCRKSHDLAVGLGHNHLPVRDLALGKIDRVRMLLELLAIFRNLEQSPPLQILQLVMLLGPSEPERQSFIEL